jgi:hypothetical protein
MCQVGRLFVDFSAGVGVSAHTVGPVPGCHRSLVSLKKTGTSFVIALCRYQTAISCVLCFIPCYRDLSSVSPLYSNQPTYQLLHSCLCPGSRLNKVFTSIRSRTARGKCADVSKEHTASVFMIEWRPLRTVSDI